MSNYTVYIAPETFQEIKNIPGNMRQRVRQAIRELGENPRPSNSKLLDTPNFDRELWRQRIDNWRIVYAITEPDKLIDIVAVRKRPPYDYGDLERLFEQLE